MTEERKYNVMTKKDLKVRWINLQHLKEMLSPYLSTKEIENLAQMERPPFTRKTFRQTYYDGKGVQRYIDKHFKGSELKG